LVFLLSPLAPLLLLFSALLVLALAFGLSLLFPLLPALLIVVVSLWLGLRLLLGVVPSLVTTAPVILSAHEDGRAQAERHNQ
jgi:hypothetical protein